jgi:hypothetical protein
MDDEAVGAGPEHRLRHVVERGACILVVDPQAALDGDGASATAFMAATPAPTSAGSRMRQAPKRPSCTRSDGQPTLRLISS